MAKAMLIKEVELVFPDFSEPFHHYSYARNFQLGATLVQDGKPLGFYTRNLNSLKLNYTIGKKELLGIIKGIKAFKEMIKGFDLTIHTDHLNLLYKNLTNQQMIRWRLLMEEFHPFMKHIASNVNLSASALSHLEMEEYLLNY